MGFAEAASAPEVVWSLVDAGFKVVAFARKGRASSLRHSRHVTCVEVQAPEIDAANTVSDLACAIRAVEGPGPVLFPLDDRAVWLCGQQELPAGWRLAGPAGRTADLALNKRLQVEAAARAGFNVPRTRIAGTCQELYEAVNEFPVILKSAECVVLRDGRIIGCRTWICGTRAELEHACGQWAERVPLLVQQFIEGVGQGVFGIATPDGVCAWSGHRRLRMMNPQGSGSSACVSEPVSEELRTKTEALVKQNSWHGLFMIELLRDKSGRVWFVELNGRPWGSMALSRRQGLEYPAWQVGLALDSESRPREVSRGASNLVCRNLGREFMHLLFVIRGPKSEALHEWPSIWKALGAVTAIHLNDTFYNWRRDDPAVFFSDCYYTVHDNLFKNRT